MKAGAYRLQHPGQRGKEMEPQYLKDPLLPVCKDLCPTWTQGAATFVDEQCLRGCSYALSQWSCTAEQQAQLSTMLSMAAATQQSCVGLGRQP